MGYTKLNKTKLRTCKAFKLCLSIFERSRMAKSIQLQLQITKKLTKTFSYIIIILNII